MSIVLTGQSLLQSDVRLETPRAVAAIRPLLRGDVVLTNFETTIKGQQDSLKDLDPLAGVYGPPEALDVLQDMGVNLLAMSNNHIYDLGQVGLVNGLREANRRKLDRRAVLLEKN